MIRILCFGTFDGVHDGHRAMLREARRAGSGDEGVESRKISNLATTYHLPPTTYLTVAVAPDAIVNALKGKLPRYTQAKRIQMLKDEHLADNVVLADDSVGEWKIIKKIKPGVIALGYDQDELRASLEEFLDRAYPEVETETGEWIKNPKRPTIITLSAHKPDTHHNRIFNSS